jgi:hypothetical protein
LLIDDLFQPFLEIPVQQLANKNLTKAVAGNWSQPQSGSWGRLLLNERKDQWHYLSTTPPRILVVSGLETLGSAEKQKAYNEIVHFLDHLTITKEMENDLEHIIPLMEAEDVENIHSTIQDAIDDTDKYIMNHQKELEAYMVFRTSESYQSTPAYKMQQLLMEFQQNSGYYEIFIANLKIISGAYREYTEKLHKVNELFMEKYPQMAKFYP